MRKKESVGLTEEELKLCIAALLFTSTVISTTNPIVPPDVKEDLANMTELATKLGDLIGKNALEINEKILKKYSNKFRPSKGVDRW